MAGAAVACLLIAGGIVAWRVVPQFSELAINTTVQRAVTLIRSTGTWGVLLSIALMTIHSFLPFPAEVLAIANGVVYGPVWGSAITWTGAMVGAAVAFGAVRLLGRPFVRRMLSPEQQQRLAIWSHNQGGVAILMSRLVPVIAFNFINYAAALTEVSFWTFMWATGIGILPLTIALSVLGDRILHGWHWLLLLVAVFAVVIVVRFIQGRHPRNVE